MEKFFQSILDEVNKNVENEVDSLNTAVQELKPQLTKLISSILADVVVPALKSELDYAHNSMDQEDPFTSHKVKYLHELIKKVGTLKTTWHLKENDFGVLDLVYPIEQEKIVRVLDFGTRYSSAIGFSEKLSLKVESLLSLGGIG